MQTVQIEATLRDKDDSIFDVELPDDRHLTFDSGAKGADAQGTPPTQALLAALTACEGIVATSFLRKMNQPIEQYRIQVTGTMQEDTHTYETIAINHIVTGQIEPKRMERAMELVEDYCPVAEMIRESIELTLQWEILEPASTEDA